MWQPQVALGHGRGPSFARNESSWSRPSSSSTKWQRRTRPSPSTEIVSTPVAHAFPRLAWCSVLSAKGIDPLEEAELLLAVGAVRPLRRVDPEVDVLGERGAEREGLLAMRRQADQAHARADAEASEPEDLRDEAIPVDLARMVGRPERELPRIGIGREAHVHREVRLDRDAFDVREPREVHEGLPVGLADQRLAPGREEHGEGVRPRALDPRDETLEGLVVAREGLAIVPTLREGTVAAGVVAARERPAIEDREPHRSSYSSESARTRSE